MKAQPFRAGDAVTVLSGECAGETWVVAVYEAASDTAWIAGWPCTMVDQATQKLRLHRAATDAQHDEMLEGVRKMQGDHGGGDPRQRALEHILATGGTP